MLNSPERWRRGAIKSVRLSNWMTFEDEEELEFEFGSGVNVVCAANASGKSALVCAIAIGLGFKISVLGRGKKLDAFICREKKTSSIEITIAKQDLSDDQISVRREMVRTADGVVDSHWSIDNCRSTTDDVHRLQRDFNLQVDSLVSFLPQDRVGEFASLNGRPLLECVLQAVDLGYSALLRDLTELEISTTKLQREMDTRKTEEAGLIEQQSRYSRVIHGFKQAERWTKEIEVLDKKIVELKLADAQRKVKDIKRRVTQLTAEMKENTKKKTELDCQLQQMTKNAAMVTGQIEAFNKRKMNVKDEVNKLTKENRQKEQENQESEENMENLETRLKDWEDKFREIELKLMNEKRKKEEHKLTPEDDNIRRELENSLSIKSRERENISDKLQQLRDLKLHAERSIERAASEKKKIPQQSSKQVIGQCRDADTRYQMQAALKEFRVDSQLPLDGSLQPVFGPLAAYIDPPDNLSGLLHHCLGARAMYFVVESKLSDSFKRFGLGSFSVPEGPQFYPKVTAPLKNVGVSLFLHEIIPHPKLRDILAQYCMINTIAIIDRSWYRNRRATENDHQKLTEALSTELAKQSTDFGITRTRIPIRYLIGDQLYSIEAGRYNPNAKYTTVRTITQSTLWSNSNTPAQNGQQRIKELEESIQKASQEIERLTAQVEEENKLWKRVKDEHIAVSEKLRESQDKHLRFNNLTKNVKILQQQLKNVQKGKPDAVRERQQVQKQVQQNNEKVNKNLELIEARKADLLDIQEKQEALTESARASESESAVLQSQVHAINRQCTEANAQLTRTKNSGLQHQQQEKEATAEFKKQKITNEDRAEMAQLTDNIQRLQDDREQTKMKRDALTRNSAAQVDYERLCENLRTCRDRIAVDERELETQRVRFEKDGARFFQFLETVTDTINQRFGSFMSQMNPTYRGRIVRTGGETFGSYGLDLEVRFRDGDPFRRLASGYQSGGEKSCAAMVFILSLQGISTAPFRVVDEINQGLDSHNETKMMRLVGTIANGDNGDEPNSQYIILTPQLVDGGIQPGFHILWVGNRVEGDNNREQENNQNRKRRSSTTERLFSPQQRRKRPCADLDNEADSEAD